MNEHLLEGNERKFKNLNVPEWKEVYSGKGVKIGIIGVDEGSHHNGAWLINQVAKDAEIIEYHVHDKGEMSLVESLQKCIEDDIDIICVSLRFRSWGEDREELSRKLYEKGVIMIDSSDNEGKIIDAYPALSRYWFVVGAYDELKQDRAGYSSYGEKLDFVGYTNYACKNRFNDYVPISHTSGATQVPSGMVALLKEKYGKFTPQDFKNFIKSMGERVNDEIGYGLLKMPKLEGLKVIKLKIGSVDITVNGATKKMDVAPFIDDNRTFVPIRFVSEELGCAVEWLEKTKEIIIKDKSNILILKVGSKVISVNGKNKEMDVEVFIENSRTFVPIRFISEELGCKVEWLNETKEVVITK